MPKSLEVALPKRKLVHELDGAVRFCAIEVFSGLGECTINYADADKPTMTRVAMKIGDYFDFKANDLTYRGFLMEVGSDLCKLEVRQVASAKAAQ
jgi:hypothetical protein